jgi:recombinational DNA repair protein RecT
LFEPDGKEVELNNNPFNVALLNQSSVRERELCYYKKDGKKIMLSINTSPVKNESGSIEGIVASIEDITKRKEYELALVESEKDIDRYLQVCKKVLVYMKLFVMKMVKL